VFVNKSLLSAQQDFDAPMFVTWFQCVFTYAVCILLGRSRRIFPWFPDIQFSYVTMKRVRDKLMLIFHDQLLYVLAGVVLTDLYDFVLFVDAAVVYNLCGNGYIQ